MPEIDWRVTPAISARGTLGQAARESCQTESVIDAGGAGLVSMVFLDKLAPYHYEVKNLIAFCRRLPVTLLADDVGLGKTISAGLVMSELMARHRIAKILVVCPKLLMPQWQEELDTKFGISPRLSLLARNLRMLSRRRKRAGDYDVPLRSNIS